MFYSVLCDSRRKKLTKACNLRYVHLDLRFLFENSTFFEKKSHESVYFTLRALRSVLVSSPWAVFQASQERETVYFTVRAPSFLRFFSIFHVQNRPNFGKKRSKACVFTVRADIFLKKPLVFCVF